MNYYEELGVSQEATEQEIRKAHRRLVKLMHPDAQPDQSLKMLAETQMRRLNSIVSTLLDPDQRRSYDEQLLAAAHSFRQSPSERHSWRGIPWWLASGVGAVVLTLGVIWLWADHMGNSFGSRPSRATYIAPVENPSLALPPTTTNPSDLDRGSHVGASYNAPLISPAPLPSLSDQPSLSGLKATDLPKSAVTVPSLPGQLKLAPNQTKEDTLQKVAEAPKPNSQQSHNSSAPAGTTSLATGVQKQNPAPDIKQSATKVAPIPAPKLSDPKILMARNDNPTKPPSDSKPTDRPGDKAGDKKIFSLPPGSLVAQVSPGKSGSSLPSPPRVATPPTRDYNSAALPGSSLPAAVPPPKSSTSPAAIGAVSGAGAVINPRDPLEGEWVYAPKEPERRRAGFYPPEFIDLKLFNSGDPGNLKGQYSAKYVVTDRPVSPEISFELASIAKGSRKFVWQSNTGAKGTLNIDSIDEHTIRVDWRTTSAVHGPALTSGTATLVRRQ